MTHPDEEILGLYALEPSQVSATWRAHIEGCADCARELQELHEFEDLLRAAGTWGDPEADGGVVDPELREFAVRSAAEDEEAVRLLDEFKEPSAAARFACADITNHSEYLTGGVARLLCKWANAMCARDPLYTLSLAEAAVTISQGLPDDDYPRGTIHELRAEALKEHANALRYLGRLPEGLDAIESAEAELNRLRRPTVTLARVIYVRGTILWDQGNLDEAEAAATEAASEAARFDAFDIERNAVNLLGYILSDRHNYRAAIQIFEESLRRRQNGDDSRAIAEDSLSLGVCYLEVGRLTEARRYLHDALRLYTALRMSPDAARAEWAIGRLTFAEGNHAESLYRLQRCIGEFSKFQILTDAALVAIDLAEILDALGRQRDIPKVLDGTVASFVRAGKLTSALAALAYLKDASVKGTISREVTSYLRHFVKQANRQPELMFMPPPSPV